MATTALSGYPDGVDSWEEGHDAWRRLAAWYQDISAHAPGDRALAALADLGLVLRLVEQAEFEAVRAARAEGKSWSEIAVRLGVTRQSAWERWRDIDDVGTAQGNVDYAAEATTEPVASTTARARRRRASVEVPNVIGMTWHDATAELAAHGLIGISPDQESPAELVWVRTDAVVLDQSPESGAKVPPGSAVRLWVDRDYGSGVREPRRPRPDPKAGHKMLDEVTDEAI
jgi:hypothetical protein